MAHSLQLHLISKSPLTGKKAFSLKIAVYHDDCGLIVVQVPDNHRHGLFAREFAGPVPPVSGYQLIAAVRVWPCNGGDQNAILPDAVCGLHHGIVILDFEGMVLERVQFRQRYLHNLFPLGVGTAFLGGKQVIDRCQLYFFRAAFQVSTPPSSDFCTPRPPCRRGREHKCSCPRRWSPWPGPSGVSRFRTP